MALRVQAYKLYHISDVLEEFAFDFFKRYVLNILNDILKHLLRNLKLHKIHTPIQKVKIRNKKD
jgi:hypothetical protein